MKSRDSRLPFDVTVIIRCGGKSVTGFTSDISLSGLFARCIEVFPPGTVCEVEVMPENGGELGIKGEFEVVRQVEGTPPGMGLRFLEPSS